MSWTTVDDFEDWLGNGTQVRQSIYCGRSLANGKGDGDVEGLEAPHSSEDSVLKEQGLSPWLSDGWMKYEIE